MKVYVRTAVTDYEGSDVIGVFATREEADAFVGDVPKFYGDGSPCPFWEADGYSTYEFEIGVGVAQYGARPLK